MITAFIAASIAGGCVRLAWQLWDYRRDMADLCDSLRPRHTRDGFGNRRTFAFVAGGWRPMADGRYGMSVSDGRVFIHCGEVIPL